MKFEYVEQKHKHGCGVACIAMILGKSYDEVEKLFENDFNKQGTKSNIIREFICDYGFSAIEKRCESYEDIRVINEMMRQPFAEIHVVSAQPFVDSENNHSLVMDSKGELFDPARPNHKVWDYYFIHLVQGYFRKSIVKSGNTKR